MIPWTKDQQAGIVAELLPRGGCVNLGVGLPSSVASRIRPDQRITLHCENGLIGYRRLADGEPPDPDVIDASLAPVGLAPGAAVVAHDLSFAIARGGRLDATVLGAYQVSARGDLANWRNPDSPHAGIGGAMDLAVGARVVIVMMRHTDRAGRPKIVERCDFPLTAEKCVDTIVTELAVFRVTSDGLVLIQVAPGVTESDVRHRTEASFAVGPELDRNPNQREEERC